MSQSGGSSSGESGSENRHYNANNLNQYESIVSSNLMSSAVSTNALLYDLNGSLTNDGVKAYFWDTQNQLIAVEALDPAVGFLGSDGSPQSSGAARVTFEYDYMGRRISKKVFEWDSQSSDFTCLFLRWLEPNQRSNN